MSCSLVKGPAAADLPLIEWRTPGTAASRPAAIRSSAAAAPAPAVDIAHIERAAWERGFQEGQAVGARKSLEQLQAAVQGFAASAAELAGFKAALRAEAEQELVALALAVARKILHRELTIDPNIILAVVGACLRHLQGIEIYRLRLNPLDAAPVAAWFHEQRRTNIQILPDPQIPRGGAVFETARGRLDALAETQLAEIERGLADR